MRLAGLSFENYRSFVDRANLEIRPITLLFGYNSAGKSAALRMLPLLAASAKSESGQGLALGSQAAREAAFRDLLSRLSSSPTLKIWVNWRDNQSFLDIDIQIRDLADRGTQIVERFAIRTDGSGTATSVDGLWDSENSDPGAKVQVYSVSRDDGPVESHKVSIRGMRFWPQKGSGLSTTFDRVSSVLGEFNEQTHWLNSLRAVPSRSARLSSAPERMTADGSNAADFLAHDALGSGELLEATSSWFFRATRHRIGLRQFTAAGEPQYSVVIRPPDADSLLEVPIVDTGEGMAQVLPVIVLGCLATLNRLGPQPLLVVEHPELHLHPAAHAELAAFLCEVARAASKPTVVVETHSENFLLRVQLAIARGETSCDDVIIHWIRGLEDGRSVIDTITFDAAARPQGAGWPPGVFAEDTAQARSLLQVRKERGFA
jgi:predicted ATPase